MNTPTTKTHKAPNNEETIIEGESRETEYRVLAAAALFIVLMCCCIWCGTFAWLVTTVN